MDYPYPEPTRRQPVETTEDRVPAPEPEAPVVEEALLVEDVSIDGMCGVY